MCIKSAVYIIFPYCILISTLDMIIIIVKIFESSFQACDIITDFHANKLKPILKKVLSQSSTNFSIFIAFLLLLVISSGLYIWRHKRRKKHFRPCNISRFHCSISQLYDKLEDVFGKTNGLRRMTFYWIELKKRGEKNKINKIN